MVLCAITVLDNSLIRTSCLKFGSQSLPFYQYAQISNVILRMIQIFVIVQTMTSKATIKSWLNLFLKKKIF